MKQKSRGIQPSLVLFGRRLVLPGSLPLLVVKCRLHHQLLDRLDVLVLAYEEHPGNSYEQQRFAEEVAHLINESYTGETVHEVGHEESHHRSTTCIERNIRR